MRPGSDARALMRLKDLATAAEIASVVVGGPLGMAIGAIGAVAGGVVAVANLRRRAGAEGLHGDFQTAMDVIGVVGAVVAVGGLAAKGIQAAATMAKATSEAEAVSATASAADKAAALRRAATMQTIAKRAVLAGEYLHVAGQGMMKGQWIVIPVALCKQLADIDAEEAAQKSPSAARFRAKRVEAWASALKSGFVQVRMMQMASDPTAGWDPFRESVSRPRSRRRLRAAVETPPPASPPPDATSGGQPGRPARATSAADEPTVHLPERPVDASAPATFSERASRALGHGDLPRTHAIKLVDPSLVQIMWDVAQAKGVAPKQRSAPATNRD